MGEGGRREASRSGRGNGREDAKAVAHRGEKAETTAGSPQGKNHISCPAARGALDGPSGEKPTASF